MTVTINGTTGITSPEVVLDNAAADGGQVVLKSSGYSNWNWDNYSGRLRAYYSATEYFTITNSGNVGIGTSSPVVRLHAMSSASSLSLALSPSNSNTNIGYITNDSTYLMFSSGYGSTGQKFRVALSAPDNAATIDTSGNLLVGKTSDTNSAAGVVVANSGSSGLVKCSKTASGTYNALVNYHNGTYVGGVDYSNTATSFPTSSDIRLKKDIVDAGSASAKIDQIRIVSHGWKHDDETVEFGVIAQELNLVAPQAVTVGDYEDEIQKTWGVDYSKLVPMLIKAHQEQQALITQLNAKIDSLKETVTAQAAKIEALEAKNA